MRAQWFSWGGVALLLSLQGWIVIRLWPQLPPTVAHHFGGGGRPDRWGSLESLVVIMFVMSAVLVLCCHAVALLIARMPASMFNLPDRDYWLSPERADATRGTIATRLVVFGHISLLFASGLTHITLAANLSSPVRLPDVFGYGLAAYLAITFAWAGLLFLRFRR